MYAYAGNNPVRYTDPDGRDPVLFIILAAVVGVTLKSDVLPEPKPVNADNINNKLGKIFYDDPNNSSAPVLNNPYSRTTYESIKLESHPIQAAGIQLPRGMPSVDSYNNPNQLKGGAIENTGTIIDILNLVAPMISELNDENLYGDVTLNYKKTNGRISSWNISQTVIDSVSNQKTTFIMTREEALKYLEKNKEILEFSDAYKELQYLID